MWLLLTPCPAEPGFTLFSKQSRSRSVGFWRSQLIWICTVCHQEYEFIATIWIKLSDWLKIKSGCGIFIYSAGQGSRYLLKKNWMSPVDYRVMYLKCSDGYVGIEWQIVYFELGLHSLRKHAYSNILKILPPKKWKFSDKNSDIFHISAQNKDCGTR